MSAEGGNRRRDIGVIVYFFVLLLFFEHTMAPFFPNARLAVGHDYSYLFPALLDGSIWFKNNGWDIPWFTPSFCAGQPYFADPQSTFYSLPQLLSLSMSPLNVAFSMLLITASLMFWGGYLVMRKLFSSSVVIALMVASMLMMNGFLPHRMLVGHVTFHSYALVLWIAFLLLVPIRHRFNQFVAALVAGAMVAYWVHSGLGSLLLAGALAVLIIALLRLLKGGNVRDLLLRAGVASVFAVCLAISKIDAASAFLSGFPRTFYTLPGGKSLLDTFLLIGGSLFLPSQAAYQFGMPRMTNLQWLLEPHEWAYNFSSVIAILMLGLLARGLWRWQRTGWKWQFSAKTTVLWCGLVLAVAWPLVFNIYTPAWNAILKTIPVINSTSTPLRWVVVYIPLIAIGAGLLLERAVGGKRRMAIVGVVVGLTIWQFAYESRDFYAAQNYDVRPISVANELFVAGIFKPEIQRLGTTAEMNTGAFHAKLAINDTMIAGVSQVFCYNPIFGYRLEKFSSAGLSEDSVLRVFEGHLNLKNPACYVFPKENNCHPGDLFRADQIEEAKKFIHYQPFAFEMSAGQKMANHVSFAALLLLVFSLLAWGLLQLRAMLTRTRKEIPDVQR